MGVINNVVDFVENGVTKVEELTSSVAYSGFTKLLDQVGLDKFKTVLDATTFLGNTMLQNTKDVGKVLGTLKNASGDVRDVLSNIPGINKDANIQKAIKSADDITQKLSESELNGTQVGDTLKSISKLVSSILKFAADIMTYNFAGLPADLVNIMAAVKETVTILKEGLKKFKTFYHDKIKPKLEDFVVKVKEGFKHLKDTFVKIGEKIEHKVDKLEQWFKTHLKPLSNKDKDGSVDSVKKLEDVNDLKIKLAEVALSKKIIELAAVNDDHAEELHGISPETTFDHAI